MIEEAAEFAREAHRGMFRKGTKIPYIVHPIETAVIVASFTDDEEIIAAALLHDVVEDTSVTGEELEQRFGPRVAGLVLAESEDKSRSWQERKAATLEHLKTAGREIKVLALGDKLSNIRSTASDYLVHGDRVFLRFNEKNKAKHAWYYWGIAMALKELKDSTYYAEYIQLCRQVFGAPVESP
ncbi:MAG TPA: HD domain-containing protein [Candidatus Enterocloster faecavium]|uniref:HD domain-containing protein n=1 Tax=Candidatus Enterocloster faecavium TaxID=2838560 RepID=A0A9D2L808_9FIRM|nr:HD domain-containing protein [Candidatus Enterocloster faecavium]